MEIRRLADNQHNALLVAISSALVLIGVIVLRLLMQEYISPTHFALSVFGGIVGLCMVGLIAGVYGFANSTKALRKTCRSVISVRIGNRIAWFACSTPMDDPVEFDGKTIVLRPQYDRITRRCLFLPVGHRDYPAFFSHIWLYSDGRLHGQFERASYDPTTVFEACNGKVINVPYLHLALTRAINNHDQTNTDAITREVSESLGGAYVLTKFQITP